MIATVKNCIFLTAFTTICVSVQEIFFASPEMIMCISENNGLTPNYERLYSKMEATADGNVSDRFRGTQIYFKSVDCALKPGMFKVFRAYRIIRFDAKEQNSTFILQNNTFNGLCGVDKMFLSAANLEEIEPDAFHCASNISVLDLSHNQLKILSSATFKDMPNLKTLYLSANKIVTLQGDLFDNLPRLITLALDSNLISNLPDGLFKNLRSLDSLGLHNNSINMLGVYPFSNCTQLKRLHLGYNKLRSLEKVLRNNNQLSILYVMHNEIKSISKDVFTENNLKEFSVADNQLQKVTPEMFGMLQDLEDLDLAFNQISSLENEPFVNNSNVHSLNLLGNRLTEIKKGDFKGLRSLRRLSLHSNLISKFDQECLEDMPRLEMIRMASNFLQTLHTSVPNRGIFSNTEITKLELSDNKLTNLSNVFHNTRVINLSLKKNMGLILDNDTLAGLAYLLMLDMTECGITSIPDGVFSNTPYLEYIILHNNRIHTIKAETFAHLKLHTLDISDNRIERLSNSAFAKLEQLVYLNASHNNISYLGEKVFYGKNTYVLDLSVNRLQEFLPIVPSLHSMNISYNSIRSLANILDNGSGNIKIINIRQNIISDITNEQWQRIMRLQSFIASNNSITEVCIPHVNNLTTLPTVNLMNNQVRKIRIPDNVENATDEAYVLKMRKFDQNLPFTTLNIKLANNPIQCDCFAYKLYKYLIKFDYTRNYIYFEDDLVCQNPPLVGKKLKELEPTDLVCNYKDDCSPFQCTPPAYDCLGNCTCVYQPHGEFRSVNCSNKGYDNLPLHLPKYTNLLNLDNNNLTSLAELNQPQWENLTEIHSEGNSIDSEDFLIPENVTFLGLRGNRLRRFPTSIMKHAQKKNDFKVSLSDNPWPCDCSIVPLKDFLLAYESKTIDIDNITCTFLNNSVAKMTTITYADICPNELMTVISIVMSTILALIIAAAVVLSIIYYRNKFYVRSLLYSYCPSGARLFCCGKQTEENKMFDGFISYGKEDRDVALAIIEKLESKPYNYRFCIHERNWKPGYLIIQNIAESVKNCKKTLIILSESFIQSKWFIQEFQAALNQTHQDKKDRLIMIVKGKLPDASLLPHDVNYILKTNTYLEWGEKWFFEKLMYAMHEQKNFVTQKKSRGLKKIFCCLRRNKSYFNETVQADV